MAVPASSPYDFAPLRYTSNSIRLIEMIPQQHNSWTYKFHTVRLEDNRPFIALSYAWGSAATSRKINLGGCEFQIGQNLYDALQSIADRTSQLRSLVGRQQLLFWIDALCINQQNVLERNHQVHLMSKIYSKADLVLVWLGQDADDSSLATRNIATANHIVTEQDVRALISLLSRPYWTRMWIVQEVILAHGIYLLCGQDLISWNALRRYAKMCLGEQDETKPLDAYAEFSDYILEEQIDGRRGHDSRMGIINRPLLTHWSPFGTEEASVVVDAYLKEKLRRTPGYDTIRARSLWSKQYSRLDKAIVRWSQRECNDPRDKVFAVLGITGITMDPHWEDMEADYAKPIEHVYKDVLIGTLCSEKIYVKLGYGSFLSRNERIDLADNLASILGVNKKHTVVEEARSRFIAGWRRKSAYGFLQPGPALSSSDDVWKLTYVKDAVTAPQQLSPVSKVVTDWTWDRGSETARLPVIEVTEEDIAPEG